MTAPVRPRFTIRPELLPARSAQRSLYVLGIIALLLIGTAAFWKWSPVESVAPGGTGVVVIAGDAPAGTGPAAGISIELRAVFVGGTPAASSAMIGRAGRAATTFRIGDDVAPGITLATVESDHVVLVENGVRSDLHLLGARIDAGGAVPVRNTPVADAAGR